MTGASFVVFNGALKTSANLTAKSSIVEDGLMVQVSQMFLELSHHMTILCFKVLPDDMIAIRKSLHDMESHTVGCGPAGAAQPDEVVRITWVDEDKAVNIG